MYPYFRLGEMRRELTSDDLEGIRYLYPPTLSERERLFAEWAMGISTPG